MILIIQNLIPHYRKSFFNKLSEYDDVVVAHSGQVSTNPNDKYKELIIPSKKIGPFIFQYNLFQTINNIKPTVVIANADIRNIMSILVMLKVDKKIRWIWWGLDKGKSSIAFFIKILIAKRENAIIFYNKEILKVFSSRLKNKNHLFVANNTFYVPQSTFEFDQNEKNIFINVGSLNKRKENDILIQAFNYLYKNLDQNIQLLFIGCGEEENYLRNLTKKLNIADQVLFLGNIENVEVLRSYYKKAIASVSFGQAGLAVLQSMAFGVPYITKRNAISGGEKFNIIDNYNGLLCEDSLTSLYEKMSQLLNDKSILKNLSQNAYNFYYEKASIDVMVKGFHSALEYKNYE